MIFNGGKKRLSGNFDFNDFYIFLENYYEQKVKIQNEDFTMNQFCSPNERNSSVNNRNTTSIKGINTNDQLNMYDDSI